MLNNKNINILQWNCRSISTNLEYLKQELASRECHVLLLQSLSVKKQNLPKLEQFYYPPIVNECQANDKVMTAIYIFAGLEYKLRQMPIPSNTENISSCAVIIKFNKQLILNCASVYLPTGPNDKNTEW